MAKGCGLVLGGLAAVVFGLYGIYGLEHGGIQSQGFVSEMGTNFVETIKYFGKDLGRGDGYLTARYMFDLEQFTENGAGLMWLYLATTVAGVASTIKGICNLVSRD